MPTQLSQSAKVRTVQGFGRVLVLGSLVVLIAVGVLAWLFVKREQAEDRQAAENTLAAVADLKVAQLTRWRQERLGDGRQIYFTPYAVRRALDAMAQPGSATTRQMFTGWLDAVLAGGSYHRALLLDDRLNVRLVHPESSVPALAEEVRATAARALRSREVALAELHRDSDDGHLHLSLIIPLVVRREGSHEAVPAAGLPPSPTDRSAGLLLLQIRAEAALFPMIQVWPTPSPTAETLLVRRDGEDVLFLSVPRHRTPANPALLRLPVSATNLPAALAVQGRAGAVSGADYRGEPVVAVIRPVPDTAWFMVAKVDQSEIFARVRTDMAMTFAVIGLLGLVVLLALGVIWRQQALAASRRELEERRQMETALRESELRYRSLFAANPQPMWVYDLETLAFLEVNDAAVFHYGYSREKFLGMTLRDIRPTEDVPLLLDDVKQSTPSLSDAGLWRHYKKNGEIMDVQIHSHALEFNGRKARLVQAHDVTQRRRAEAALRESERFARSTLDSLSAHIAILDDQGIILAVNQAWRRFAKENHPIPEAVCEGANHLIACDVAQGGEQVAAQEFAAAIRGVPEGTEQEFAMEYPCHSPTEKRWFLGRVTRFRGGGPVRVVVAHENITRRKQAEAALRESEERFRRAVVDSPFPILLHAEDGAILQASNSWCEITGYSHDELATIDDWTERAYGDRKAVVRAEIEALYALEQHKHEGDYVIRTRRGEFRTWEFSSAALGRLPDGRRLAISMALDVTARRQAEAALAASEARYRTLVENIPLRVFLKDTDLRYVSCNRAYASDVGVPADQLAGQSDYDLQPQDLAEKYRADDRRILASGVAEAFEEPCRLTGEDRTVQTFKTPVKDAEGHVVGLLGAFWDITDRKRLERERRTMEIHLRQQQRLESIGTLAGGVAHEINNPVTGIMNYAQLIQDRLPAESPLVEFSQEIIHETERVAGIVRNLLTFARTEKQSHRPARLADIVNGVLTLMRTVIRHDNIALTVNLPSDLPPLRCRTQQIQQVLMNLLTNARDALNERHPGHDDNKTMSLTAGGITDDGGRWIRVTVEDHGTGITPEVRERMFDPFFTTKPRDIGTGLGLSISHGIVKEHDGRLTVESEPGQFTRLHLDLPIDIE